MNYEWHRKQLPTAGICNARVPRAMVTPVVAPASRGRWWSNDEGPSHRPRDAGATRRPENYNAMKSNAGEAGEPVMQR